MATILLQRLTQSELRDVSRRAARIGVCLETYVCAQGWIWVSSIEREGGSPGAGMQALEMLCELADETDATIGLAVLEDCEPVIDLYRSAGFEEREDPEIREERDGYIMMVRDPQ